MAAPNGKCRARLVVTDDGVSGDPIDLYWDDSVQYYTAAASYTLYWNGSSEWIILDVFFQQWEGGFSENDASGTYTSSNSSSSSSTSSTVTIEVTVHDSPCSPSSSSSSASSSSSSASSSSSSDSSSSSSGSSKSSSSVSEGDGNP